MVKLNYITVVCAQKLYDIFCFGKILSFGGVKLENVQTSPIFCLN